MRSLHLAPLAAACLLAACSPSEPAGSGDSAPRHVMLITVDTLRADHLSMNGYERETSPHLDAFAADALHYEQAIAVLLLLLVLVFRLLQQRRVRQVLQ